MDTYLVEPTVTGQVDVKARTIIVFFVVSFLVAVLSGIPDRAGAVYFLAKAALCFLLILSLVLPSRIGIPLWFILLIAGWDLMQSSSGKLNVGEYNTASVWRLQFGPIRSNMIMITCLFVMILKTGHLVLDRRLKRAIVWFVSVPVLTGVMYGGFTSFARAMELRPDIRFALMLVGTIILFCGFFRKYPEYLGIMLAVFIGALLGRHLCDLLYWMLGLGQTMWGVSRGSVDSAKSGVVFLLLFSIYLIVGRKKILIGTIMGLLCGLLVIVFGTRMIWITSVLCCAVLFYVLGVKKGFLAFPVVLLVVALSWATIKYVKPESVEALAKHVEKEHIRGSFLRKLGGLRYAEFINSTSMNIKRGAVLWGSGYGGYYTDHVIAFPANLVDAHPEYAAKEGTFFYCHNYFSQILFKHGVLGLIIITSLWLGPAWWCYRYAYDRMNPSMFNGILACLIAFIPNSMLNLYWSGKGNFISAFIIAVLITVVERQYREVTNVPQRYEMEYSQSQV